MKVYRTGIQQRRMILLFRRAMECQLGSMKSHHIAHVARANAYCHGFLYKRFLFGFLFRAQDVHVFEKVLGYSQLCDSLPCLFTVSLCT